jgi:hypothetical protein
VWAGDVDATAEETALASLLQAEDVAPATSDGPSVSAAEDLPGYVENSGLREVRQTWFSEDPVRTVFDFRWQFQDAASAEAFLDAAEEALSETSSGARPAETSPVWERLEDTRHYRYQDTVLGTDTVGYNFLMRAGNLVGKVYVAGSAATLEESDATAIYSAAAERMILALQGTDPAATAAPATAAPASTVPGGDEAALGELLSHVPAAISGTCIATGVTDEASPAPGELAEARCETSEGAAVTFLLYDTVEAMDAAYDTAFEYARIFGSFTTAGTCEGGGYEGTWNVGAVDAGRLLCHELRGDASIVWSHPATRILSIIRQSGADHAAAWQLWLAAGPE